MADAEVGKLVYTAVADLSRAEQQLNAFLAKWQRAFAGGGVGMGAVGGGMSGGGAASSISGASAPSASAITSSAPLASASGVVAAPAATGGGGRSSGGRGGEGFFGMPRASRVLLGVAFGAMETERAFRSVQRTETEAGLATTSAGELRARAAGLQEMRSGPFMSLIAGGLDLFGKGPAAVERSTRIELARVEAQTNLRDSQRDLSFGRQSRTAAGNYGAGKYADFDVEAVKVREGLAKVKDSLKDGIAKLTADLVATKDVPVKILHHREWHGIDMGYSVEHTTRSAPLYDDGILNTKKSQLAALRTQMTEAEEDAGFGLEEISRRRNTYTRGITQRRYDARNKTSGGALSASGARMAADVFEGVGDAYSDFAAAPPEQRSIYAEQMFGGLRVAGIAARTQAGDIGNDTDAMGMLIGGNKYGAAKSRIEASRNRSLRAVPAWLANLPVVGGAFGALRGAINANADSELTLNALSRSDAYLSDKSALDFQGQSISRLLARDPIGAQAYSIAGAGIGMATGLRKQFGGPEGDILARQALENTRGNLNVLRQTYLDSFRATQIGLNTTDLSNPRDSENPTEVLKQLRIVADKIFDELQALGGA